MRTVMFYVDIADLPAVQEIADRAGVRLVHRNSGLHSGKATAQFYMDENGRLGLQMALARNTDSPKDRLLDILLEQRAWDVAP